MAEVSKASNRAHPYDESYFEGLNRPSFWGNNRYREAQRIHTLESLCRPREGDDVLDLGCGTGRYTRILAGRVRRIVGVDFSAAAIGKALASGRRPNMEFRPADIRHLGMFRDRSFDKIVAVDVLEHLSDDDLRIALDEVRRLLKNGGLFVFFTPCGSHWIERLKRRGVLKQVEGHIGVRSEEQYRRMIEERGLRVQETVRYPTCIPVFRRVEQPLMRLAGTGGLFVSRLGAAVSKLT